MQTKVVLIRQRPAIGDALLLYPLIKAIKTKFLNSYLTVITDSCYCGGALPLIFSQMPEVDQVECIEPMEWTTDSNKRVDPILYAAGKDIPYTIAHADLIFDCNGAFIEFERAYGDEVPYGIAEFWLRHFDIYSPEINLLPYFEVTSDRQADVATWQKEQNIVKPMVGIVLRAGDPVRDWDFNNLSNDISDWLHTSGYTPVGIDPIKSLTSIYGRSCVGKKLDFVAALLQACTLVLTPDTGLLHLAQAVGTPTVALWGIMRPELRVKGYNTVVVPKNSLGYCPLEELACKRCWLFQRWSCMKRITLPMIIDGLQEALQ